MALTPTICCGRRLRYIRFRTIGSDLSRTHIPACSASRCSVTIRLLRI